MKTKLSDAVRLRDTELDLYRQRKLLATELAADQEKMVAALAAGGSLETVTDTPRRASLETLDQAILAVRRARPKAIREEFESRANSLRLQAQGLRATRAKIIEATAPLLAQLAKLEDLKLDRSVLQCQRVGRFYPIGGLPSEFALEDRGPGDAAADIGAGFGVPKSHALLRQAVALEHQAADLEETPLARDGDVEAATLDGVIAAAYSDPCRLSPNPAEIEQWATDFEAQFFKGRHRASIVLVPTRFRLMWSALEIVASSFVEFEAAVREAA
jgi:hypothetical protein